MMTAYWLPNGNLLVPMPAYTDDPNFHGDGLMEVEPGSALFAEWEADAIADEAVDSDTALTAAGGFNPSQARVPKGNRLGGRWVGTAGALADGLAGKMGGVQDVVKNQGGASLDPVTLQQPTTGYMVARPGFNQEIPEADFFGPGGEDLLYAWIEKNQAALSEEGSHIGLWHDTKNGEVTLDVSQNVEDLDEAKRLGEERNQQSIWDIVGDDEIDTGGTGDRQPDDKLVASGRAAERRAAGGLPGLARRAEAGVRPRGDRGSEAGKLAAGLTAAGGNPAQLRVPKGNDDGGQWVDSPTTIADNLEGPDRRTAKRLGGKGEPTTYAALGADPVALQKNVNPGGYKKNCQRVGMAVEMQARGFPNAVAPDNERTDPTNIVKLEQMWKPDPATGRHREFQIALDGDPNSLIADDPVGARYLISGRGKRGGGHVWNAEKGPDGKLIQIDGQIGEEAHPERMDFGQSLLRVDDLDPSFAALAGSNDTGEGPWVVSRATLKEQVGA